MTQLVIDNSGGETRPHVVESGTGNAKLSGGGDSALQDSTESNSKSDPSTIATGINSGTGHTAGTTAGFGTAGFGRAAAVSGAAHVSRYIISGASLTEDQRAAALAYEERQKAALQRALPREFDWQTYLLYHPGVYMEPHAQPRASNAELQNADRASLFRCRITSYYVPITDLRAAGIATETLAKQHYIKQGRAEGRVYKRLRVVLRYTACTGAPAAYTLYLTMRSGCSAPTGAAGRAMHAVLAQ